MKRYISMILVVFLLMACIFVETPMARATGKTVVSRSIAIVFDNSGSMYEKQNKAWCRATYAMEVFASMLNENDQLQIYPMNPIEVNGQQYTMETPLVIKDPTETTKIHNIFTPHVDWKAPKDGSRTHIETIDYAAQGLEKMTGGEKYLVILTDGTNFYEKNTDLAGGSKQALEKRIGALVAKKNMKVMFLGIDQAATMPDLPQSEYFVKEKAENSASVLKTLTQMCNLIFGRDSLPANHISGRKIDFDMSMKKLIVFVQGENIDGLKVVNGSGAVVGKLIRTQRATYSTRGTGKEVLDNEPDTSLQGMIVTYEDCAAGEYDIQFSGNDSSIEVYYEPDADLDFVFTDAAGNTVDPQALYEGDYKVSFGMKDGKTGKLIASDLLGNPKYKGAYYIDGKEYPITHEGFSGSVAVPLKMGEKFAANLTVTYLSGYTISKDSSDFGWPEGGITVAAKPAGEIRLEISGGASSYSLQDLESGEPYIVKVYYQGTQLTGEELEKVELKWEPETSNAEIKKTFADDHWKLSLHYKDPSAPQDTVCGECTVSIYAFYTPPGSSKGQGQSPLTYNIIDDYAPLQLELDVPQTYIVIKKLQQSEPIVANLKFNGKPLNSEEFVAVNFQVDCGGIEHTITANEEASSYSIKLLPTEGIAEGNYQIKVTALYTDHIGRETAVNDAVAVTLSNIPLWVRWTVGILLLLIIFLIIWAILHIKVLPTKAHTTKKLSNLNFDGEDVTKSTSFLTEIKKDGARMQTQYGGRKFGLIMDVAPGQESYLYKPHKGRSAVVKPASVRKFGPAKIQEALIGTAKYAVDDETGKLVPAIPNQKPFLLKNGTTVRYSGTISDAGIDKDFEVLSKISFNKK